MMTCSAPKSMQKQVDKVVKGMLGKKDSSTWISQRISPVKNSFILISVYFPKM